MLYLLNHLGGAKMARTEKGKKQVKTMIARHGKDIFRRIGSKGGNPILIEQGRRRREAEGTI